MKLVFLCPYWGLEHLSYHEAAKKVNAAGYDGMEIRPWDEKWEEAVKACKDHDLALVLMSITGGNSFTEYKENHQKLLEKCVSYKPLKVNSHTGKDHFSFAQNSELIRIAEGIEKKSGVEILHETHRSRVLYSAPSAVDFFKSFPQLKITADFSHWVNVSESLLQDQPETMEAAIRHTHHIHTRVGHPEGPQVNDPRAPEWKGAVEVHISWWDKIVKNHLAAGTKQLSITCEFGPAGYLPTLPYTQQPVASQWDINLHMMNTLKERWSKML